MTSNSVIAIRTSINRLRERIKYYTEIIEQAEDQRQFVIDLRNELLAELEEMERNINGTERE